MSDPNALAQQFDAARGRLLAIATRVLGNRADAEDVVQEAWFRLARQDTDVENVAAWLTTVVGRLSIDVLRSRAARKEVDLPNATVTDDTPEQAALRADAINLALLVVLDTLSPDERLAFVLHDVFGLPFAEVGPVIGKSADAAKMTASRARRKLRAAPNDHRQRDEQRAVVDAFLAAARDGDFEALLRILDPDVVWEVRTSRGVTVRTGNDVVARAAAHADPTNITARRVLVNGRPGILAWNKHGRAVSLMACTVEGGRMTRIDSLVDPRRLATMDLPAMR